MQAMKELKRTWKGLGDKKKMRYGGELNENHSFWKCNPKPVWSVTHDFNDNKKKAVKEIVFGSFIHRKMCHIDKKSVLCLVDQFIPFNYTIELHEAIKRLMGLPNDGSACYGNDDAEALEEMRNKYKLGKWEIPFVALHQILTNKDANMDEFKVLFTLFLMGTTLSPTY